MDDDESDTDSGSNEARPHDPEDASVKNSFGEGEGKDLETQVPPLLCAPRVSGSGTYQSNHLQDEQSNSKQDVSFVRGS